MTNTLDINEINSLFQLTFDIDLKPNDSNDVISKIIIDEIYNSHPLANSLIYRKLAFMDLKRCRDCIEKEFGFEANEFKIVGILDTNVRSETLLVEELCDNKILSYRIEKLNILEFDLKGYRIENHDKYFSYKLVSCEIDSYENPSLAINISELKLVCYGEYKDVIEKINSIVKNNDNDYIITVLERNSSLLNLLIRDSDKMNLFIGRIIEENKTII